ncbi:LysR family transcriptional regulator [Pseudomonas rhizoryzae]|uniref:LysR family transcriptional regulator n=1 Tax=Pseudomonas rhizoryzae TaxID=2571129 RepID=UPI0007376F7D|nr:LysR family transcriptional regulator [Pseudomonas rhizoryzae]KTT27999.1 LysR family transcriptional regulator [Pseudomonas psychrotolerans]KTT78669.1 LysR family transcriptional regulator [Pseudomonas psychrotolerans]
MITDRDGELNSPKPDNRLPSLLALRCFEAAARQENFTRAAAELHLTHGAVSRAVRGLEDDLGLALFERRSRRVFLTDAGRQLAQAVQQGLEVIREAVSELRAQARQQRQWVLSCEPTLLMRWLIPRWPDFQARHPELEVLLVAGGGPCTFSEGIDLAIRRDDFIWPATVQAQPLFAEWVGPVCRPDRAPLWFAEPAATLEVAPRLHTRTRPTAWECWATAGGLRLPEAPELTFEHFYFSLQAAVAGLGVAIGPWALVGDDLASGLLVAPQGFLQDGSHYHLLSAKPIAPGTPPQLLLDWLRSQAPQPPA